VKPEMFLFLFCFVTGAKQSKAKLDKTKTANKKLAELLWDLFEKCLAKA
jgi:hypothetical protein